MFKSNGNLSQDNLAQILKIMKVKNILLLIALICINGCSDHEINTTSEALNNIVNSADYQIINLDKVNSNIIELKKENIIYSIHNESYNNSAGHIYSAIRIDSFFYISDLVTNSVHKINKDGRISSALTRAGKGPGELNTIGDLFYNSNYLFIPDYNNGRINIYSYNMVFKNSINNYLMKDMNVTDKYIFGINRTSYGFYPEDSKEGLIVISSVNDLSDTIKTIMPRIIPEGFQPQVFNSVKFSINNHGRIISRYVPLPWIFIYDQRYNHVNTLLLSYTAFDTLNIPELNLFKPKGTEGYGGQNPINDIIILDNDDIYLTIRNEIVHLFKNNYARYEGHCKIRFVHDLENPSSYWTWIFNKVFATSKNSDTIYVHNPEYMIWFTKR